MIPFLYPFPSDMECTRWTGLFDGHAALPAVSPHSHQSTAGVPADGESTDTVPRSHSTVGRHQSFQDHNSTGLGLYCRSLFLQFFKHRVLSMVSYFDDLREKKILVLSNHDCWRADIVVFHYDSRTILKK